MLTASGLSGTSPPQSIMKHLNARLVLSFVLLLFVTASHADDEKKAEEYRLQQTDVIRMSIYQEDDMQTEALIGKSGTVSFPLIGAVTVKGLTVSEVEKKLKELYEKDYLVNAKVNVIVVSYAKKWVTVSGSCRKSW